MIRMNHVTWPVLTSAVLVAALLLPARPAGAAELTRDELLGFAAARSDAYANLSTIVYTLSVGGTNTLGDLAAADPRVRERVEVTLRSAYVVEGPVFDPDGPVDVVVELNTQAFPYELRGRLRDLPPFIRVDGVADKNAAMRAAAVAVGPVTDQVKEWVDSVIEAEGTAEVERSTRDPEQAKEEARRRATALAYTAVGKKVETLLLDEGVTVKGFLDQHPDLREPLNAALMQGKLVSESLDVEGVTYKVAVSLLAAAVARPLRLGRFREARGTVLMPEQAAMARENARADAASTLVKRISDLRTRSGITAGELIEKRASMKADIERLCRVAPIERVEITEDGMCKMFVSITTDMLPDEVRRLIVAEKPIRVFAIGAGLPVPPKKPEPPKPPAEKPPEQPAENVPAERPAEKPAENPAERPAQPGKAPG